MEHTILITGGAGFIGSHLVDRLVDSNNVVVYDNLTSGRKEFIKQHINKKNFKFVEGDLLDINNLKKSMRGCDFVYHLAANPDVRYGIEHTDTDLKQGTIATYNVLESMRLCDVKNIAFSSSSVIYGDSKKIPTPEDYGPLMPISLYGASKLACEGLVTAYSGTFDMNSWIFRFANIVGKRGTHGILVDFIDKLNKDNTQLEILGNGKQKKSYLPVEECADAMIYAVENSKDKINIFNLGCGDQIFVDKIANIVVEELGLENVKFNYSGGQRGWKGDVPEMMLSIEKIKRLGWKPSHTSEEAVRNAVRELIRCRQ